MEIPQVTGLKISDGKEWRSDGVPSLFIEIDHANEMISIPLVELAEALFPYLVEVGLAKAKEDEQ